jgi:hypothetical protein
MNSIKFAVAVVAAVVSFNSAAEGIDDVQDVTSNVVACVKTVVNNGNLRIEHYERIVEQTYEVNMTKLQQKLELVGVERDSLEWKYLTAKHAFVNSYKGTKNAVRNKLAKNPTSILECE